MKKLAFLTLLALACAVSSCGNSTPTNGTNTSTSGNWLAQLTGGTGQASELNFVTAFSVTNSGPLNVTGFGFFNTGACFATGLNMENESGSAAFTTSSTNQVTGTLSFTVNSINPPGNTLTMTGNLTGTSNGTTTTTGTLSNGVVAGTWTLTGDSSCTGGAQVSGNVIMCQVPATGGVCKAP
jgi:hypothetical protein